MPQVFRPLSSVGPELAQESGISIDPHVRARARTAWNQPVRWPAWTLAGLALAGLVPAVVTWRRERRV